jgi:hypothetical protein
MLGSIRTSLGAGTRVRVRQPGPVPEWSVWDPCQRTSTHVKRRLQQAFFKGDRKIQAEVVYIASESLRERLRSANRVKVELRDSAGSSVTVLADAGNLVSG